MPQSIHPVKNLAEIRCKNASNPCIAPGRVSARITMMRNIMTNAGIKIRFAISIPFFTPLNRIPNTSAQTMIKGINTPGTRFPICPGTSAKFR